MEKNILTVQQCADALGVTHPAVQYHLHKGNLPGTRWLDTWVIQQSDLDAFIAAKKAGKFNRGRPRKETVNP